MQKNKSKFRKSISFKIILYYAITFFIIILGLLFFTTQIVKNTYLSSLKKSMLNDSILIEKFIGTKKFAPATLQKRIKSYGQLIDLRVTIIDAEGTVIADSDIDDLNTLDNHLYRKEILEASFEGTGSSIRYSKSVTTDLLYFAKKYEAYFIRIAKPLREIEESLAKIRRVIITAGFITFLLAIIINILISQRITMPIREAITFADQFAHGDFSQRIVDYSKNELGILQKSLNRLADNLQNHINNLIFEQKKLTITLESINNAIVLVNSSGKIILTNKSFNELFRIKSDPTNKNYFEIIRSSNLNKNIEHALQTKKTTFFEDMLQTGEYCEIYMNTIKEHKELQGILVVLHDITEKKRIETIKTDLVGNLSHELKTPIAIVKGYLETIEQQLHDKKLCKDLIQKTIKNIDRQNSIITDMLKLNLLETTYEFGKEHIIITELIESCLTILAPKMKQKSITLHKKYVEHSQKIPGSRFLAEEIFVNLLDNAINYNKNDGAITITSHLQKANNNSTFQISIRDTGIGIPAEHIDRIFERFYRIDKGRSRLTGGTGLGLSIVKHAAELLGWEIHVDSYMDGTEFTVIIPLTPANSKQDA